MLGALLRHDRTLVLAGLVAVVVLSWVWLLTGAGLKMDEMDMGGGQIMLMAPPWTVQYAAVIFLMWVIMMAAMMLPSAAPAILLVIALTKQRGGVSRQARERRVRAWLCRGLGRVQPHRDRTSMGVSTGPGCFPGTWPAGALFWRPFCCSPLAFIN